MKIVFISLGFRCNQARLFHCQILWGFLGLGMLSVIYIFLCLNSIILKNITIQKPESIEDLRVQQLIFNKFCEYCPLIFSTCSYLRTFMFTVPLVRYSPSLGLSSLAPFAVQVSIQRPPPQGDLGYSSLKQPLPTLSLYHVLVSSKLLLFLKLPCSIIIIIITQIIIIILTPKVNTSCFSYYITYTNHYM